MSSDNLLNLDRDLPTTSEDVAALRRAAEREVDDPFAVVQALSDSLPPSARGPRRTTCEGWAEFRL